jgi:hypothetical protein
MRFCVAPYSGGAARVDQLSAAAEVRESIARQISVRAGQPGPSEA